MGSGSINLGLNRHNLLQFYWSVLLLAILFGGRKSRVLLVSPNTLPFHLSFSRAMIIRCWRQHIISETVTFCLRQIHKCLQFCCRAKVECNHMGHKNSSFHTQTRELFSPRLNLSIFVKKLVLIYRQLQNENHCIVNVRIQIRLRLLYLHIDISIWATHPDSTSSDVNWELLGQNSSQTHI